MTRLSGCAGLGLALAAVTVFAAGCSGLGPTFRLQASGATPTVAPVFLPQPDPKQTLSQAIMDAVGSAEQVRLPRDLSRAPAGGTLIVSRGPEGTPVALRAIEGLPVALSGIDRTPVAAPTPTAAGVASPGATAAPTEALARTAAIAVPQAPTATTPSSPPTATPAALPTPTATRIPSPVPKVDIPLAAGLASETGASRPNVVPPGSSHSLNQISEVVVYDDELHPDWSTEHSQGVYFDLVDPTHAHNSRVGLTIIPRQDFGQFFLTVRPDAVQTYGRDRVFGVSLWINGGSKSLDPNSLSVTVVGSNSYPYWVAGDNSVQIDDKHFFVESSLQYLGINGAVPPKTWVEAVVWLDKLRYAPDFKYITGIYIKNNAGFRRTFYIDQVRLLLAE